MVRVTESCSCRRIVLQLCREFHLICWQNDVQGVICLNVMYGQIKGGGVVGSRLNNVLLFGRQAPNMKRGHHDVQNGSAWKMKTVMACTWVMLEAY